MKKLNIYLLACLLTIAFTACNDDFLERYPLDEVSNETFWNTENDLMVYNNSLYHLALNDDNVPIMHAHYSGFNSHWGSYWFLDGFSDNLAPRHDRHAFFQQVRAGRQLVPNGPQRFGYKGWNFVRAINVGLENYGKADIPDAARNKYVGEARLLRGWFYAEKVQKFGDVPWVDRELNIDSDELFAARTPREEAMNNVLEDLNFATEHIPEDWGDGNEPGRLNKWAALAIKSRLCLYEGTWRKYHGGSDADMWLREAAEAAQEVIENSPYAIYNTGDPENDFNSFMRKIDISGNPEVMVYRRYQLGIYTNHVQSYFSYTGGATKSFVEDFLDTDGLPITLSSKYMGDETFEAVFENRDPRLRQTILHPDDTEKYKYHRADGRDYPRIVGMPGGYTTTTGYHIIKHYNADDMIGKAYNTAESPGIILRYAEVLLNYAEAKAELGEITQGDLDMSINLLRDRVAMPHLTLNPPMDPRYANDGVSSLIVEIRRERRVELFLEGFRYKDLKRWKQGKKLEIPDMGIRWSPENQARFAEATVQTSVDPESGNTYIDVYKGTDWADPVFDEAKHYLWPLPLDDLAQNPQLQQNPGYN
jgi:hypothetical protein